MKSNCSFLSLSHAVHAADNVAVHVTLSLSTKGITSPTHLLIPQVLTTKKIMQPLPPTPLLIPRLQMKLCYFQPTD